MVRSKGADPMTRWERILTVLFVILGAGFCALPFIVALYLLWRKG